MAGGATSLAMVRDELFATIEEAEAALEQFVADRQNGSLLQQAVENLQQVRGTLSLIELIGAKLLAQDIFQLATDIPVGAGEDRDTQLASLSTALFVLRRYLEHVELHQQEIPELLLPAINELRQATSQPPLPESFFFSVRLDHPRPACPAASPHPNEAPCAGRARRLRHMYQVGLLGFLREQDAAASLRLMARALTGLDRLYPADAAQARLCWVSAAAVETQREGQLLPRRSRKQLFSRVDRELRQMLASSHYEAPRSLLKELLYLVALGQTDGELAVQVRETFGLAPLPFTDQLLEEQYRRLSGPGQGVMRSLSSAISEELAGIKDLLDLIERNGLPADGYAPLHGQLVKLSKTLAMIGLGSASSALATQAQAVARWPAAPAPPAALLRLADALLYTESTVASLERGRGRATAEVRPPPAATSFADHQLIEAHIVVLDEARAALALAKRAISAFLESGGDKLHLGNVPDVLHSVRGGLWFLDRRRAARLVGNCGEYIQRQMLEGADIPSGQMLETLADALTSLEYYLEAEPHGEERSDALDLAEESVRALGPALAA